MTFSYLFSPLWCDITCTAVFVETIHMHHHDAAKYIIVWPKGSCIIQTKKWYNDREKINLMNVKKTFIQSKVRSHFSWSTITHDTFTIMWSTITHDHFVKILNDQITIMIGDHFADHAFLKSKYTEGIFLRKEPYILKAHDVRMSKILRSRAFGINLWIFLWKYIPSTQKVYRKTW